METPQLTRESTGIRTHNHHTFSQDYYRMCYLWAPLTCIIKIVMFYHEFLHIFIKDFIIYDQYKRASLHEKYTKDLYLIP